MILPVLVRILSASVRVVPAGVGLAILGYLGLIEAKKHVDFKPEKWEEYDLVEEAKKSKERFEKEK